MTRCPPWRLVSALLFSALLASVCPSQTAETARQKVLGKVERLDGKPWAQATVRLVAWSYPHYWFIGTPDKLTVTTDERGRFEARLLPQRHYSAWAFETLDGGGYRISKVVDDIVPAYLVQLHERQHAQAPLRLRIVEPAGAEPFGPLSFRVISRNPSQPFVHDLQLDDNGEVDLPPVPSSLARIEALTSDGVRVWNTSVGTTSARRAATAKRGVREYSPVPAVHVMAGEEGELSILKLPKPTLIKFSVKDANGPVAGAEILIGAQTSAGSISDVHDCRVMTRTDASGVARLPMYLSWREDGEVAGSSPDVVVRSEQHFERMFRMMNELRGERLDPTRESPEANVTLAGPSFTTTGKLLLAPGKPAVGVPVLLYDSYSSGIGRSRSSSTRPIVTTTDAGGDFAFVGRVLERDYRLTALLPTSEANGREEVYLAGSTDAEAGGKHGTLVASKLVHVDFQITTSNGSPADRARIYLAEERNRPATPITYLTDRSGRCSVRVPREKVLCVIVASDDGFAAARLDHAGKAPRVSQTLKLKIGGTVTGIAVDTKGKPLADVRVSVRGGDRVDTWYRGLLRDVSSSTYALNYRLTYTDADGKFRAVFPVAGSQLQVSAWRRGQDGSYMQMVGDKREIEVELGKSEPMRLVLDHWKR